MLGCDFINRLRTDWLIGRSRFPPPLFTCGHGRQERTSKSGNFYTLPASAPKQEQKTNLCWKSGTSVMAHQESPSRRPWSEQQQRFWPPTHELASPTPTSVSSPISAVRDTAAFTSTSLPSSITPSVSQESVSTMDIDNVQERNCRATSVLSMDDIEAAQALEGLRSGKSQLWRDWPFFFFF